MHTDSAESNSHTVQNRWLRTSVTMFLFAQVLLSYVFFGLFRYPALKNSDKLRPTMQKIHAKNAIRVYKAFSKLKGVYIKVGQFLSTQAMLPPEYLTEMVKMQDRVPTASTARIHQRITEQYGKPESEVFASFTDEPLACASIGQVHRVTLLDGRDCVLKVKYPDIDKSFNEDLDLLRIMVPIFVATLEWVFYRERTGIDHRKTIGEFVKYIRMELDYANEVENHKKMYAIMQDRDDIVVPKLVEELCTSATICMEYIDATRMTDFFSDNNIADEAKNKMYEITADGLLYQVSKYGFFQADTHPGNFMVIHNDGAIDSLQLVMLDFGCSKQLPNEFRQGILKAFQGYINKDAQLSAQSYWDMGFRTKQQTLESLENWADFIFGIIDEVVTLFSNGDSLTDFIRGNAQRLGERGYSLAQSDRIDYVPEEYIMFGRAIATPPIPFDQFQPKADLLKLVMPHVGNFAMPQAEISLSQADTAESA